MKKPKTLGGKSVIVYGNQGEGKSLVAEELRRFYKLDRIEDELGGPQAFQPVGVLYLTNHVPDHYKDSRRVVSFSDAMAALKKSSGMKAVSHSKRVH